MGRGASFGKIFVLIILIILLIFGGMLWFDYLGIFNTRSTFSPIYSLFGKNTPQGVAQVDENQLANLNADRYEKRLRALEVRSQELDKLSDDLKAQQKEQEQIASELDERKNAIEEKEKNFNAMLLETDDRKANILQIARYMNGMRPEKAVANLLEMDDQDIIDVLRGAEEISKKEGKMSLVAYWFSLMPPSRAAEIQRKMANKPPSMP